MASSRRVGLRAIPAIVAVIGLVLSSREALAQTPAATAEVLFEQGRDLLRAGKAVEACPKLAESQRLDPATGTLLALALCHEAEGKLASAWAEFVEVQARAETEKRADRQQVAAEHAKALRPLLSTLELRVPDEVAALPGIEIRRDGVVLGRSAWNVAVPVDGGEHALEATATGRMPWNARASVKRESDTVVIDVQPLGAASTMPPVVAVVAAPPLAPVSMKAGPTAPARDQLASKPWGPLEFAGLGAVGAGAVGLGVGAYFLSSALSKKSSASEDCIGDVCGPDGFDDRTQAVSKGKTATAFGIGGGVLAAVGATLFIVGRTTAASNGAAERAAMSLAVAGGPGTLSARMTTEF